MGKIFGTILFAIGIFMILASLAAILGWVTVSPLTAALFLFIGFIFCVTGFIMTVYRSQAEAFLRSLRGGRR